MVRAARCDSCRFWHVDYPDAEVGQCRIRHPRVFWSDDSGVVTLWPEVARERWCGEWQEAYRKKAGDAGS